MYLVCFERGSAAHHSACHPIEEGTRVLSWTRQWALEAVRLVSVGIKTLEASLGEESL